MKLFIKKVGSWVDFDGTGTSYVALVADEANEHVEFLIDISEDSYRTLARLFGFEGFEENSQIGVENAPDVDDVEESPPIVVNDDQSDDGVETI